MSFNRFIEEGKVRKGKPDLPLAQSLINTSDKHLKVVLMLDINETTKETIFVMSYEALRELIESMAIREGYKVYSHEAFTFYLQDKGNDALARKFDRYRKLRNGVNYYGKEIPLAEVQSATKEIQELIKEVKKKYLK